MKFSNKVSSLSVTKSDLVTFNDEIFHKNFIFCAVLQMYKVVWFIRLYTVLYHVFSWWVEHLRFI